VAISAFYALDKLPGDAKVGILDVDAHHGNGIAHCVQDQKRIKYASIHEKKEVTMFQKTEDDQLPDYNPRGPTFDDKGPNNNIRNFQCEKGTEIEE